MQLSANLSRALLGILATLIATLVIFAVLNTRATNVQLAAATLVASPSPSTPTQIPYPLPATTTPNLTPQPTIIRILTPPASLVPPPPPGTPRPTPLTPNEELRQTLMRFPTEKRMLIDPDTIAVIGIGKGDAHDGEERRDRMVISI
jgi:hypothetical protein